MYIYVHIYIYIHMYIYIYMYTHLFNIMYNIALSGGAWGFGVKPEASLSALPNDLVKSYNIIE